MLEHEPALFCAVSSRAPRRCVIVALWTLDGATRRAVMALRVTGQRRAVAGKRRQLPIEANFKEVAPPLLLLKVPQCSVHSLCACWLNFARSWWRPSWRAQMQVHAPLLERSRPAGSHADAIVGGLGAGKQVPHTTDARSQVHFGSLKTHTRRLIQVAGAD